MNASGTYVLPQGAVMTPVRELTEASQREIGTPGNDDVVLSRANSRACSKVLGPHASALIAQFRTPRTVAQAVARFCRDTGLSANAVLEETLPMLQLLFDAGFLVAHQVRNEPAFVSSPALTTEIDGWKILRSIQTMEDTEIYQVCSDARQTAALKIGKAGDITATRALRREAHIVSSLRCTVTPRLLSFGFWNSRPYLITEWLTGAEADNVCDGFRAVGNVSSKKALRFIAGAVLRAYVTLHEHGVIHGDVNPRNVLIGPRREIKLVDFGAARILGDEKIGALTRRGVCFFLEPEFANAIRVGACPPLPSPRGEQYSLGALIYFLLTGRHYLNFIVEKAEMLRQIAEDRMVSFSRQDVTAWPGVEGILMKALAKKPSDRFSSVAEFARALELVTPSREL
jgi:eukaryotic-like serine/threonine-protein kinase